MIFYRWFGGHKLIVYRAHRTDKRGTADWKYLNPFDLGSEPNRIRRSLRGALFALFRVDFKPRFVLRFVSRYTRSTLTLLLEFDDRCFEYSNSHLRTLFDDNSFRSVRSREEVRSYGYDFLVQNVQMLSFTEIFAQSRRVCEGAK